MRWCVGHVLKRVSNTVLTNYKIQGNLPIAKTALAKHRLRRMKLILIQRILKTRILKI